jgi:hypothetical protein
MRPYRVPPTDNQAPVPARWRRIARVVRRLLTAPLPMVIAGAVLAWPAVRAADRLRAGVASIDPAPCASACPAEPPVETPAKTADDAEETEKADAPRRMSPKEARAAVARTARAVVEALERRDLVEVAAHTSDDLRLEIALSSDGLSTAPSLSPRDLRACSRDPRKKSFGGGGEDLFMTCAEYLAKVTHGVTFSTSMRVTYNRDEATGSDEFSELRGRHPQAIIVEYGVPGFQPGCGSDEDSREGGTLRLVFRPEAEDWRLAAIVRD